MPFLPWGSSLVMSELSIVTAEEAKTSFPRRSKSLQSEYADCYRMHTCVMRILREKGRTIAHQSCDSVVYIDTVEQVLSQTICDERFVQGWVHYSRSSGELEYMIRERWKGRGYIIHESGFIRDAWPTRLGSRAPRCMTVDMDGGVS